MAPRYVWRHLVFSCYFSAGILLIEFRRVYTWLNPPPQCILHLSNPIADFKNTAPHFKSVSVVVQNTLL
jgi:hypothetical protein